MTEYQKTEAALQKTFNVAMTTGMFAIILFSVFVTSSMLANKFIVPKKYDQVTFSTTGERIQKQVLTASDIALASVSENGGGQ